MNQCRCQLSVAMHTALKPFSPCLVLQARCVILDRFTRPASAPHDARYNADTVTYNPPVLALLTVGGLSSSGSSIGKDGFRMSLVHESSSPAAVLSRVSDSKVNDSGGSAGSAGAGGAAAVADRTSGSGGSGGSAADAADDDARGGGERFAFSVAACAEVHVAFDADFTEEWLPVTLNMMQLDLTASATNSCAAFHALLSTMVFVVFIGVVHAGTARWSTSNL